MQDQEQIKKHTSPEAKTVPRHTHIGKQGSFKQILTDQDTPKIMREISNTKAVYAGQLEDESLTAEKQLNFIKIQEKFEGKLDEQDPKNATSEEAQGKHLPVHEEKKARQPPIQIQEILSRSFKTHSYNFPSGSTSDSSSQLKNSWQ